MATEGDTVFSYTQITQAQLEKSLDFSIMSWIVRQRNLEIKAVLTIEGAEQSEAKASNS